MPINRQNTKMIRIPSKGIVYTSRGRVVSPITRPYRENIDTIFNMLNQKPTPTIIEILPNGREITLTIQNYDKDNELIKPVIDGDNNASGSVNRAEQIKDEKPEQKENVDKNNYKKENFNKKNRHNKQNNQYNKNNQFNMTENNKEVETKKQTNTSTEEVTQNVGVITDDTMEVE